MKHGTDGRTTLIQSFIQSRYVNMILEQQFFLRARCRFPFRSSRFKVSDTYLRLLPSVRPFGGNPISVRARNGQMTLQERLKEGREGRGRAGHARDYIDDRDETAEREKENQDRNRAARRQGSEREENNNPIRRESLSSRQIS